MADTTRVLTRGKRERFLLTVRSKAICNLATLFQLCEAREIHRVRLLTKASERDLNKEGTT